MKENIELRPARTWAWRAGMSAYRFSINTFFRVGGLSWLKRKYREGIDERMGNFSGSVIPRDGIWVHAVSVGEVQSASALIKKMKEDCSRPCVLSTVTPTGRKMAQQILEGTVERMIYSPWDTPRFITSALDAIRPAAYISMETELWPEILSQLRERRIPTFLANGRISEASFKRLRRQTSFWRGVLSCFTRLFVRFDEDRDHFLALGVPPEKITVTGDCKVDTLLDRRRTTSPETWGHLRRGEGTPLFVAGSTHPGEDDAIIAAFRRVHQVHPDARLVIVPRHPERALMVVAAALPYPDLQAELLSRLSSSGAQAENWDIAVVDRIGVLFDLYAAADAAFVGGSLVLKGGQNPFEPTLFGIPMTHGPCMTDFPDTERMDRMGAARCIHNDMELAQAWEEALTPAAREKARTACQAYFDTLGGAARRTWEVIREYVKQDDQCA
ncbi:MAG: 3-deoxy-D-manno-octulosonic acid transferase [Fretibacterium sp.]|nr:3-deoxy-D-manno-octulosonic acid transferase [Fretibacterium sp.]